MQGNLLFSPDENFPGMRLQRFELLNWGGFDGAPVTLDFDGKSLLLAGLNRSGKTTILDGMATLYAVDPRYNQSAENGTNDKGRTISTYVIGKYGEEREEKFGGTISQTLRSRNTISILLGYYADSTGNCYTVGQYFWFTGKLDKKNPEREYFIAPGNYNIGRDILLLDSVGQGKRFNIDEVKKNIKRIPDVEIYRYFDSKKEKCYSERFMQVLGITSRQGFDFIAKTISVRGINDINKFICERLPPRDFGKVLTDLLDKSRAVQEVARIIRENEDRISVLTPLVNEKGEAYKRQKSDEAALLELKKYAPDWLKMRHYQIAKDDLEKVENVLETVSYDIERTEKDLQVKREERDTLLDRKRDNGGELELKYREDIHFLNSEKEHVSFNRNQYERNLHVLNKEMPAGEEEFQSISQDVVSIKAEQEKSKIEKNRESIDLRVKMRGNEKAICELEADVQQLREHKGNIEPALLKLRDHLARKIGVMSSMLPFVGELIEVPDRERAWEGPINKLLYGFAISMLVPVELYKNVAKYIEGMHGQRIVYYKVDDDACADSEVICDDRTVICGKIRMNAEAPMTKWLAGELLKHFPHQCCMNIDDFAKEKYALTLTGQYKGGRRHVKDDRRSVDDVKHYVLGFSNERKIKEYEKEISDLRLSNERMERRDKGLGSEIRQCEKIIKSAEALQQYNKWEEIDIAPINKQLAQKETLLDELLHKNDTYRIICEQIAKTEQAIASLDSACKNLYGKKSSLSEKVDRLKAIMTGTADAVIPTEKQEIVSRFIISYWNKAVTMANFDEFASLITAKINDRLNKLQNVDTGSLAKAKENLVKAMEGYLATFPADTSLSANVAFLGDFEARLQGLIKDNLKRKDDYDNRFLNDMFDYFLNFNNEVTNAEEDVRIAVDELNKKLGLAHLRVERGKKIYVRVLCEPSKNGHIARFREELKRVTDGAHKSREDADKRRTSINNVLSYLTNCDTTADQKFKEQILDVRHWFIYSLQLVDEDDKPVTYYHSTSGDSTGGQESIASFLVIVSQLQIFDTGNAADSGDSFRFIMMDELSRNGDIFTGDYVLQLLQRFHMQGVFVTPGTKLNMISPYVGNIYQCYLDINRQGQTRVRKITHKVMANGNS